MELQTFTCPNCGKSLEANPSLDTITCNACGTSFTPEMDTAKLVIHKASNIINKAMDQHQENKQSQMDFAMKHFSTALILLVGMTVVLLVAFMITQAM